MQGPWLEDVPPDMASRQWFSDRLRRPVAVVLASALAGSMVVPPAGVAIAQDPGSETASADANLAGPGAADEDIAGPDDGVASDAPPVEPIDAIQNSPPAPEPAAPPPSAAETAPVTAAAEAAPTPAPAAPDDRTAAAPANPETPAPAETAASHVPVQPAPVIPAPAPTLAPAQAAAAPAVPAPVPPPAPVLTPAPLPGTASGTGQQTITAHFPRGAVAAASRAAATVDLQTRWGGAPAPQAAAVPGPCLPPLSEKIDEAVRPTVIGELNNAYRDTRASWAYGSKADSKITVGLKVQGKGWEIGGSRDVDNELSSQVDASGKTGPYSRQFTSDFRYAKYKLTPRCINQKPSEQIRAEEWIGGISDARRQRGAIRNCPSKAAAPQQTVGFAPGTGFRRDEKNAVTWSGGVNVFGVGLDVKSGFSKWVRAAYRFGGRGNRTHWLCGSAGKSPNSGGRIYSGVTS